MATLPIAIGAGLGALGGLFGGSNKISRQQADALRYWLQRQRDQEAQATRDLQGYVDPSTGVYVPGSRGDYKNYLDQIANAPGYTPQEQQGILVSPQEEAGLLSLSVAPTVGAANAARDQLVRSAAARGNYSPGLNAAAERIQQEGGRQAAEAARNARLGVAALRRQGWQDIGNARIGQQNFAAGGRLGLASLDQARQLGSASAGGNLALGYPPGEPPWWKRIAQGAAGGAFGGYVYGGSKGEVNGGG